MNTLNMGSTVEWRERHKYERVEAMTHDAVAQIGQDMVDSSTQTGEDMELEGEILQCFKAGDQGEAMKLLLEKVWPDGLYRRTRAEYTDLRGVESTLVETRHCS